MKKVLIIILLFILSIILYATFIEPKNITTHEYVIKSDNIPSSFKDLKIVHFSDLLYNNDKKVLNKITNIINELHADIIIFSGDLFNKDFKYKEKDFINLKDFLKSLDASLYKYAVIGDNDKSFIENYKDILYESEFNLLDNSSTLLFYKDVTPIKIIGISQTNEIENLLQSDVEYNYSIAITHKPDNAKELKNHNVNLVLSGHSLGGVINVPFYGGLIKKDGANNYVNGYYSLGNTSLYINNGLGYEGIEFRLLNTPSISIYRFN